MFTHRTSPGEICAAAISSLEAATRRPRESSLRVEPRMGRRMEVMVVMVVVMVMCGVGRAQDLRADSCQDRCDEIPNGQLGCACDPYCKGRTDCCPDYDELCITITRGDVPDDFEPSVDEDYTLVHPEADISHEQEAEEERGGGSPTRQEGDTGRADAGEQDAAEERGDTAAEAIFPPRVPASPPQQRPRPPQPPQPPPHRPPASSESVDRRPGVQQPHVVSTRPPAPHWPPGEGPGLAAGGGGAAAEDEGPAASPGTHDRREADLCSKEPFNAFMTTPNGTVLAFRGDHFWELFPVSGAPPSAPRLVEEVWGVPPPIDAAFTRMNCQALSYIFKGDKYWRFSDGVMERGFPRSITRGFPRVPASPDAAFAVPLSWRSQEHAYFFKGGQYYKYVFRQQPSSRDCRRRHRAPHSSGGSRGAPHAWDFVSRLFSARHDHCYPRDTARSWRGVPTRLDAVMMSPYPAHPHSGQDVYFYSGDNYYRVDLRSRRVERATPQYPRSIAQYWLNCKVK